ncbi:MAG: hypothetical protein ACXABV_11615 [Candidatus Thorarchaeota archaeon]
MTVRISDELKRTVEVLRRVLRRVSDLNKELEPLESELSAADFATSGIYVIGTSAGVVCFPAALSEGDPMKPILDNARARGAKMPSIVEADDPEESISTCERVVKMLKREIWNKREAILKPSYLLVIRWDHMYEDLEDNKTVIIGKRYISGSKDSLKRLTKNLKKLGLSIIEDSGQYGGGPMTYELIQEFSKSKPLLVAQLTFSRRVATDEPKILAMLEMLSSFQVHSHDRYQS